MEVLLVVVVLLLLLLCALLRLGHYARRLQRVIHHRRARHLHINRLGLDRAQRNPIVQGLILIDEEGLNGVAHKNNRILHTMIRGAAALTIVQPIHLLVHLALQPQRTLSAMADLFQEGHHH